MVGPTRRCWAAIYPALVTALLLLDLHLYRGRGEPGQGQEETEREEEVEAVEEAEQHRAVLQQLERRRTRLRAGCLQYQDRLRAPHHALLGRPAPPHNYHAFHRAGRNFRICRVPRAGIRSWQAFTANTALFQGAGEEAGQGAGNWTTILQVRHPFLRLLSSWLDTELYRAGGAGRGWEEWVEQLLTGAAQDGAAPLQILCDLCEPLPASPSYILKLERLGEELGAVMALEFGLRGGRQDRAGGGVGFPRLVDQLGEAGHPRAGAVELAGQFYSKLGLTTVLMLYTFYEIEFQLFDYNIDYFVRIARPDAVAQETSSPNSFNQQSK